MAKYVLRYTNLEHIFFITWWCLIFQNNTIILKYYYLRFNNSFAGQLLVEQNLATPSQSQ